MQIVVDEQLVHYEKIGSGKIIVLIHGWADSLNSFRDLQIELAKNFEVYSLDLPGFAQSSPIDTAWDLDDFANFVSSFTKKLKLDVYAYVGHSYGGAILIYGLGNHVLSAKKLVLLASAGIRDQDQLKKQIFKVGAKTGKVATAILPKTMRESIRKKYYQGIGSEMLLAPAMEQTFRKIISHDIKRYAGNITIPTLLMYGQNDTSTPPAYGEAFKNLISSSTLKVVDHAGHFVHHDQPELVKGTIEGFLK